MVSDVIGEWAKVVYDPEVKVVTWSNRAKVLFLKRTR